MAERAPTRTMPLIVVLITIFVAFLLRYIPISCIPDRMLRFQPAAAGLHQQPRILHSSFASGQHPALGKSIGMAGEIYEGTRTDLQPPRKK